ncbi:26582_t:CDS:1, partial [Racocetra persica]
GFQKSKTSFRLGFLKLASDRFHFEPGLVRPADQIRSDLWSDL